MYPYYALVGAAPHYTNAEPTYYNCHMSPSYARQLLIVCWTHFEHILLPERDGDGGFGGGQPAMAARRPARELASHWPTGLATEAAMAAVERGEKALSGFQPATALLHLKGPSSGDHCNAG